MELGDRPLGITRDDRATNNSEHFIVRPETGERERCGTEQVNKPRVLSFAFGIVWGESPFVKAVGLDEAPLRFECVLKAPDVATVSILALNMAALGIPFAHHGTSHQRASSAISLPS